jgi:hypothetical protein
VPLTLTRSPGKPSRILEAVSAAILLLALAATALLGRTLYRRHVLDPQLAAAVEAQDPETAHHLLEAGARHPSRDFVDVAAYTGDPRLVRAALASGDSPAGHPGDWTPLTDAVHSGNPAPVRLLIDAGADVNARDRYGITPLMWACVGLDAESVQELLRAGAAVNLTDPRGRTAWDFHDAAFSSSPMPPGLVQTRKRVAALLRSRGARPGTHRQGTRQTPPRGANNAN